MAARRRRNLLRHDKAWHDRQMARGPIGLARDAWGADTWPKLHRLAARLMAHFDSFPQRERRAAAFPNPEDR